MKKIVMTDHQEIINFLCTTRDLLEQGKTIQADRHIACIIKRIQEMMGG